MDFLDEEFNKPSVFVDESKLSSEYVPDNLLFREDELRMVVRHFRGLFSSSQSTRKLVITGSVGTGKTSIAKKFGNWAEKKSVEENTDLQYVHVNCRRNRTPFMILLAITRELNSHVPTRGYSADELMEMVVELLEARKITMLLTLDEIDYTMGQGGTDLIYALTRSSDDRQDANHRIALILISRNSNFLSELDASTKSSLSPALMKLDPYSKHQLIKIIGDRVRQSFLPGSVTNEALILASEISSTKGDARQALELMWYAGKFADKENSSLVQPEHVRLAKSNVDPSLLRRVIIDMSNHKLSLLLGIARELRLRQVAYITTGRAVESYKMMCETQNLRPRKHTQIWEYLKEFERLGVLVTRKSGVGQRGNTQMISIQDVSAKELEQEVSKQLERLENQSTVH